MTTAFLIVTLLFVIVSVAMVLIILVQRPQGGGLAGAFGGAGGGSSDTVFGGRVGDALTWATVVAFVVYLSMAIALNRIESAHTSPAAAATTPMIEATELPDPAGPGDAPAVAPRIRQLDPSEVPAEFREAHEKSQRTGQPE